MSAEPIAVRDYSSLVEALCQAKLALGLSDALCDDLLGTARGTTTKYLGPLRDKKIGHKMLDDFLELFAIELVPRTNPAAVKRMSSRWEMRDKSQVRSRSEHHLSARHIRQVTPLVFSEMGKKSASMLTVSMRTERAKKAANARWNKVDIKPAKQPVKIRKTNTETTVKRRRARAHCPDVHMSGIELPRTLATV